MKRALAAVAILCGTSGCYTVVRHPDPERAASSTFYDAADYALGMSQDCAACHDPGPGPRPLPWPAPAPPWVAYNTGPWWERTRIQKTQGDPLPNVRPRPPLPEAPIAIDLPADGFARAVKPAPGELGSAPVTNPHAGGAMPPVVQSPHAGSRDAGGASAPHAPADRTPPADDPRPQTAPAAATPREAAPAVAVPSVPAHGTAMSNARPRPS